MKLQRARAQTFKNIDDSGWVGIDQITCLVGKTNFQRFPIRSH